jgi:hypothetical protein
MTKSKVTKAVFLLAAVIKRTFSKKDRFTDILLLASIPVIFFGKLSKNTFFVMKCSYQLLLLVQTKGQEKATILLYHFKNSFH